jgi:8-oxo-dGTP pyrophosphatase MutT (NUDIX family)
VSRPKPPSPATEPPGPAQQSAHTATANLQRLGRADIESVLDPDYEPSIPFHQPIHRAAVAAVLRRGHAGAELLFIQRAAHPGDPWSGQIAFPGGRTDPDDPAPIDTARRETWEELGLELTDHHEMGTLLELDGGRATKRLVLVSAHGFWLEGERPALTPNYEVAETLWVPLVELASPARHIDYYYPPAGASFPGVELDKENQVLWGLTLRFVSELFARLGHPFLT